MNPNTQAFVDKIRAPAQAIEEKTGIPWRFSVAQAAHESGYGSSGLTVHANNLFGVTGNRLLDQCGLPEGTPIAAAQEYARTRTLPVLFMETGEHSDYPPEKIHYWSYAGDIVNKQSDGKGGADLKVLRPFRSYDSWFDSLTEWSELICRRYMKALAAAQAGDFPLFAQRLQEGGYATDPRYVQGLIDAHRSLEGIA